MVPGATATLAKVVISIACTVLKVNFSFDLFSRNCPKTKCTGGAFRGPLEHTLALVDHTTEGKFPTTTPHAVSPFHHHQA
jgi:hypothetical protein